MSLWPRHRAAEWNLDPQQIGLVGYSAGANLTMNLVASFDAGDPHAADGARHDIKLGFHLGQWGDGEVDGQSSPNADGDAADEDGVVLTSRLVLGGDFGT